MIENKCIIFLVCVHNIVTLTISEKIFIPSGFPLQFAQFAKGKKYNKVAKKYFAVNTTS